MYQGTTPTLVLNVEGAELDTATCYVTIRNQGGEMITKSGAELDVSGNEIAVRLTQEETLQLRPGLVNIQVRWIDAHGNAMASNIARVNVNAVLLKSVITYQEEG